MMIMRWCTVQTNEYDLRAKTYPNICTHHKLHNNDENKFPIDCSGGHGIRSTTCTINICKSGGCCRSACFSYGLRVTMIYEMCVLDKLSQYYKPKAWSFHNLTHTETQNDRKATISALNGFYPAAASSRVYQHTQTKGPTRLDLLI